MELLQLKYFMEVAKLESITRAAESLHISQPALSQTMKRLEQETGTQLFERKGRSIHLTTHGRVFYTRVSSVIQTLDYAIDELKDIRLQGSLVIGTYSPLEPLLPCLDAFARQYPDVTYTIYSITNMRRLNPQDFDVLLMYGQSNSLNFRENLKLSEFHGIFVLPKDSPKLDKENLSLIDLKEEPFVSLLWDDGRLEELFDDFAHMGIVPNIRYKTNSSSIKRELLMSGMCAGSSNELILKTFPEKMRQKKQAKYGVRIQPTSKVSLYLGFRATEFLSPVAKTFKEFAIHWFQQES